MKRLNVIAFFVIFIVCISNVVYADEQGVEVSFDDSKRKAYQWCLDIEGEKPNKINDEFNVILYYFDIPLVGGRSRYFNAIDCSIKYPKNQVEFISTEVESDMYVIRKVPEESEYGYIYCCLFYYNYNNNKKKIFYFLKFKFKAIASGEINFIADVESAYVTYDTYQNSQSLKYIEEEFSNISLEHVVDIPIEHSLINVIKKDDVCYLTGIDEKTPLGKITSLIPEEYTAIISTANGNHVIKSDDTTLLKTGDTIIIAKKEIGDNSYTGISQYKIIIYGDTNGDGKINSGDALAIVKNKTNAIPFTEYEFKEAGRVQEKDRGTEAVPSAIDALMIIKHKLGKYKIVQ